jgi:hypothetical protein
MSQFKLLVDPSQIGELAARYKYEEDSKALSAGARIRNGDARARTYWRFLSGKQKGEVVRG